MQRLHLSGDHIDHIKYNGKSLAFTLENTKFYYSISETQPRNVWIAMSFPIVFVSVAFGLYRVADNSRPIRKCTTNLEEEKIRICELVLRVTSTRANSTVKPPNIIDMTRSDYRSNFNIIFLFL